MNDLKINNYFDYSSETTSPGSITENDFKITLEQIEKSGRDHLANNNPDILLGN